MKFLILYVYVLAAPFAVVFNLNLTYTIIRKTAGTPDIFQVPTNICTLSGFECNSFNKRAFSFGGTCKCSCPNESATFGFHNGSWSCRDNTEFREQTDCKYTFVKELGNDPMKVLSMRSTYNAALPSGSCLISLGKSRYFQCNGLWTGSNSSFKSLTLITNNKTFRGQRRQWRHDLKVGKASFLAGKIVSLHIICETDSSSPSSSPLSSCLLFKIAGTITCPISFPQPSRKPYPKSFSQPSMRGYSTTTFKSQLQDPYKTTSSALPKLTVIIPTKSSVLETRGDSSARVLSLAETISVSIIVIIVVIIIIAVTGIMIWKKRRGGKAVCCEDRIITTVRKFRLLLAKRGNEGQPADDPIYAEPYESRRIQTADAADAAQRGTSNYGFEDRDSRYVSNDQLNVNFYRSVTITATRKKGSFINNTEGQGRRPDSSSSSLYITLQDLQTPVLKDSNDSPRDSIVSAEEGLTDDDGYLVPIDSPTYNTLRAKRTGQNSLPAN